MEDSVMKRWILLTVIGFSFCVSSVAWSYDTEMAKSYEKLFASCSGASIGKELHFASPEGFVKNIKAGKEYAILDVRTPEESSLFAMALPNTLNISLDQIFKPENLSRVPKDKPVMVICQSGVRAATVGTALRHIGFDNVYILMGGIKALSSYYGPRQAYAKDPKIAAN
jgi:rhodanese-related sulfurtransferase